MAQLSMLVTTENGEVVRASGAALKQFGACIGRSCAEVVGMRDVCAEGCARALVQDVEGSLERTGLVKGRVARLNCTTVGRGVVVVVCGEGGGLSPRESEVASLAASGKTMEESANMLGLSVTTVRSHLDNARKKLGCRNVRELAVRVTGGLAAGEPG